MTEKHIRFPKRKASKRPVLFLLFFISGFCGLVYQVIWTRLAFAAFGIITPVLSVVISVFMLGLSLGAWAGGKWAGALAKKTGLSAITLYALAEMGIGVGGVAVPTLFGLGERALLALGQTNSLAYLFFSALVLAASILPWCVLMGTTFPFVMAYLRERRPETWESFSFLYLANVLGATCGTLLTALVLVELLGFRHTLWLAAAGNLLIAGVSARLGWGRGGPAVGHRAEAVRSDEPLAEGHTNRPRSRLIPWVLFWTGLSAMAMEVVWIRAFAPVIKTQVYSFAWVVATYLAATFAGSLMYRRHLRRRSVRRTAELLSLLSIAVFLPVVANDPGLLRAHWGAPADPASVMILLVSICPFCAVLGYLTPRLVDEYSAGSPPDAGRAYAVNVFGCILGPLLASYLLLPWISDRHALILLGLPFSVFFVLARKGLPGIQRVCLATAASGVLAWAVLFAGTYEDRILASTPGSPALVHPDYAAAAAAFGPGQLPGSTTAKRAEARRDYAASVVSFDDAQRKHLLVNGIGMTALTPTTKFMVHLPLAFHQGRPESALIICFGMGTSYRSALSWDIATTTVELVPSVKEAFGFYHADAAAVVRNPKGRIVIDDGRRFLARTRERFDVIVIDPPPPVEAAGSSLLYAREFYELAKRRLKPGGILQAWYPGERSATFTAILQSVCASFPYVRCFEGIGKWGTHMLASMQPIAPHNAAELAARLPLDASKDLLEWSQTRDLATYLDQVVSQEIPVRELLGNGPRIRVTDDQPYNEYFLLRQAGLLHPWR